jgi:hypothetical protein
VSALAVVMPGGSERTVIVNNGPTRWEPSHFVRGMEEWRRSMGLTSNAFADYLKVSRSYWSLVRRGLRPVSMPLALRVLRERPELGAALVADAVTFDG